jgi:PD-(D/E)XK nuclease superfamily protein
MNMKWSISAHNMFQRCQRQYLFNNIMASETSNEELRREAHILKQLQGWSAWQGSLVHEGIRLFLMPQLRRNANISTEEIIVSTQALARQQFAFSQEKSYRNAGMTRDMAGSHYAALYEHEFDQEIDESHLQQVLENARLSLVNLFEQRQLLEEVRNHRGLQCESFLRFYVRDITVWSKLDLVFFRPDGHSVIIDWKIGDDVASDYSHQVMVYALAAKHRWPRTPVENFEIKEVNLLKNTIIVHPLTSEKLLETEDFIYRSGSSIRDLTGDQNWDAQRLEDFEPARSVLTCQYCKFRKLCQEVYS